MKIRRFTAALLVAGLALATGGAPMAAEPHQHAPSAPSKLTLDHGKRWTTDEPLRAGMNAIRAQFADRQHAIHAGTLSAAEYKALGAAVETQVADIVATCKLEPAADANLHLIVAELLAGADAMQGKTRASPASGAVRAVRAINQYGRYFDHPGFKPLA
jgi:hypothetical protein